MAAPGFSPQVRRQLLAAAEDALGWEEVLARTGDNVVTAVLGDVATFYQWQHYPEGDVQDPGTGAQYYYHAHPPGSRPAGEHGHFHLFVRPAEAGMDVRPAPLPDFDPPDEPEDLLGHLIGVSVNADGQLRELFTTNRWVTAEHWFRAEDVIQMLPAFGVRHARPSWPLNRWLESIVSAFAPEIAGLVRARDQRITEWEDAHAGNVFEDRALEYPASLEVNLNERVHTLRTALDDSTSAAQPD